MGSQTVKSRFAQLLGGIGVIPCHPDRTIERCGGADEDVEWDSRASQMDVADIEGYHGT